MLCHVEDVDVDDVVDIKSSTPFRSAPGGVSRCEIAMEIYVADMCPVFVHAGTDGLAAYSSGILDALQSCQH